MYPQQGGMMGGGGGMMGGGRRKGGFGGGAGLLAGGGAGKVHFRTLLPRQYRGRWLCVYHVIMNTCLLFQLLMKRSANWHGACR